MQSELAPASAPTRIQGENPHYLSSASGAGNTQAALAYISKTIPNQQVSILNSYANVDTHETVLDLSGYLIPGWTLYEVEIEVQDTTAAAEREVVGKASTPSTLFQIWNYSTYYYYNQLTNGFYNKPHNGSLLNYSVSYYTLDYSPISRGTSYLLVCSDYSDSSSGLTTPEAMSAHASAFEWITIDGENINLTQNTVYYTLINGTELHKDGVLQKYPHVYWGVETVAGSFTTRRYSTEWSGWSGSLPYEALLNYTYIPWDASTNLALVYSQPSDVSLTGNSTDFSGASWSSGVFSQNITSITLSTDQSVDLSYNVTLWYSRSISASTTWQAENSGGQVVWNSSISVTYPSIGGQVQRFLNYSVQSDWTIDGLYNSTFPATSHNDYSRIGNTVVCSGMDSETWVLFCNGPNYVTEIGLFDSSDDSVLTYTIDVDTIVDVNTTVESPASIPATTGSMNLTVVHSGATAYAPANAPVTDGKAHHTWNTGTNHDENGIHKMAVYWSNGTEAGYRTHDIVLVYPTEMTTDATIDAFTDSAFQFRIFFGDTYTPQPLNESLAIATYSFDGGSNFSMTDHANGTWSSTVDTTGRSPGTYDLIAYGEGFAFANISRTIKVTLIHETQALDVSWSNGPDITYVEDSELIVVYRRTNGDNVTNAQVNATIGIKTWNLTQQIDGSFRIRFNGTDDLPGFGVHPISISAWKAGYEAQSDNLQTLTIGKEATSLQVSWSNTNNITFLDNTILSVKYLMSNGTEISGAELNVTIDTNTWDLLWNSGTSAYEIQFNGTDASTGLGTHYLLIQATLYGYNDASDSSKNLTIREEPTAIVLYWSAPYLNNITYIQQTTLYANFTILDNTPIQLSTVNVTFGTTTLKLTWDFGLQRYWIVLNGTDNPPEFGNHSLSVQAWKHGFQANFDTTSVVIRRDPTTLTTNWPDGSTISYVNQTTLVVHYRMSNNTDIENAIVNVTINGETWDMTWEYIDSAYKLTFNGTDSPFLGTHDLTISAWRYGFIEAVDTSQTLVIEEESTHLTYSWLRYGNITYFEYTYFFVYYKMSNSSIIPGATLNVTISSDSWDLLWNSTQQAYGIRFNGSDAIPGLGTHTLNVTASAYGFETAIRWSQSLIITLEGTDLSASWSAPNFDSITYLESTELRVSYEMRNGTPVLNAIVNVTIGTKTWNLTWSGTYYSIIFNGTDIEPGFGLHNLTIKAGKVHFQNRQNVGQSLTIDYEPTTITPSWQYEEFEYHNSTTLIFEYRDSHGTLIAAATQKQIWINSTAETLQEIAQGYRILLNNRFDLGYHLVIVNISKYGYTPAYLDTVSFSILNASTHIIVDWSSGTIEYLGSFYLTLAYNVNNPIGFPWVPSGDVVANISIDGATPLPLNLTGVDWTANLTGAYMGLGTHSMLVRTWAYGYEFQQNLTILAVDPEPSQLILTWESTHNNIITFVEYTTLYANYTLLDGTPLTFATVNVSISGQNWDLHWNPALELYQIQFNGTDNPPEFGSHSLSVQAWKYGYSEQSDSSQMLIIDEESTSLSVTWSDASSITYLQKTTILVEYTMSNGTSILDAPVVVTIGLDSWPLIWNGSIYRMTFNGTDLIPGIGTHNLNVTASKYGYEAEYNYSETLNIAAEPTNAVVTWEITHGNNITFLESTILYVSYTFPNGTAITGATVTVTISTQPWLLTWNGLLELYEVPFDGADNPPGFGNHTLDISAWKFGYVEQTPSTSLHIRREPTTITPSWLYEEFEYHNSTTLLFEYRDSHGTLITAATQKQIWINSTAETLQEIAQGYRILLNNRFDLGYHLVIVNISKYGYTPAYLDTVSFSILNASTHIIVDWSSSSIEYLGNFYLILSYNVDNPIGFPWVPTGDVIANISIDGATPLPLNLTGVDWTANLTGAYLGLGAHSMLIRTWAYGYEYQQNFTILTVNLVPTSLEYEWSPANLTIEYTMYLNLTVNYTYYGGDIPDSATVNVTINNRTFDLNYVGDSWEVSILGSDVNTGVYDATIRASYAYFTSQTALTIGINITPAANTFLVEWTPHDRNISYAESVSIAVVYTHDYEPVLGANVTLTINGTGLQNLTYSLIDEKWHIGFDATALGLGIWNFTIRANRTGYESGEAWYFVLVEEDIPNLTPSWISTEIDYLSSTTLQIDVDSSNGSAIIDAIVEVTLLGSTATIDHFGSGVYNTSFGPYIDLGVHSINVTFTRFGFQTTTIFLTLNVTAADATLTLDYTPLTIYYDESVSLNASYLMTNMSYIPGSSFQLFANTTAHAISPMGDHWEATFSGAALGLGLSECLIIADAYGFRSRNATFTIIVVIIPTQMAIGSSGSTYVNGTYRFIFTYEDTRTSTHIDPDLISIDWPGTYGYIQLGIGQFEVTLNADLHNGSYFFILNLSKAGHVGATSNQTMEVMPIPIEIISESSIIEYEDEVLEISIYLNDTVYVRPVHWASVVLSFHGSDYYMTFNPATESYHCQIHLGAEIPTGDYSLSIMATAIDCNLAQDTISLSILPKDDYSLILWVSPSEVEVGDMLHLTATLSHDSSPVAGMEILFVITVYNQDGSDETTLNGITDVWGNATVQFQVPERTTSIRIMGEFEGSRTAWAKDSQEITVAVRQTPPSGLLDLLSDPFVQLILAAAVAAVVSVGYSRSRRKPKAAIDSSFILQSIGALEGVRYCILCNTEKRSHILAKSYLATSQDSFIIRALEDIAAEGLKGKDLPGFAFEMSLHGQKVFVYGGKMIAGVLTAYAEEKVRYKENLQLLVDTFEEQFEMEIIDWPKNISVYGDIWRVIGPDTTDAERVKTFVFSIEEGALRAEIANRLNLSIKKVRDIVKQILDSDPDFQDIRVGRKKLVRFRSALSDEIS